MAHIEGNLFARLRTQKNCMQIAQQVLKLRRDGTLKVGDKLPPERAIVERLGDSRASVREALSALEMLGLIECRGGLGSLARADGSGGTIDGELPKTLLQNHDPFSIFEARLEREPSLAALAAERATEEERGRLKAQGEKPKAPGP